MNMVQESGGHGHGAGRRKPVSRRVSEETAGQRTGGKPDLANDREEGGGVICLVVSPLPSDHFAFAPIASPRRVVTGDLCSLRPYLPSLPLLTISEVVDYCPISRV